MKLGKNQILLILGIIISVVCTWLFARHIDWITLKYAFKEADYLFVIPTLFLVILIFVVRTLRWKSLLSSIKRISFINLFSATCIGYMANHVLPARVGEIIRPLVIAKKENIKITPSLATIVLERIFDLLGLIVFTVVILMIIPASKGQKQISISNTYSSAVAGEMDMVSHTKEIENSKTPILVVLKKWIGIFAGIGAATVALLMALAFYPEKIVRLTARLFSIFPHKIRDKMEELLESFISGLQILGSRRHIIWIFFLTVVIWVLLAATIYVFSFSFNMNLPFTGACLVTICIAFAVALPQAPGYIGVFHIATQKTLEIFGIEMASSQSFAITLWALSIIPITIVGIFFMWREGIAFKDIVRLEKQPRKDAVISGRVQHK